MTRRDGKYLYQQHQLNLRINACRCMGDMTALALARHAGISNWPPRDGKCGASGINAETAKARARERVGNEG